MIHRIRERKFMNPTEENRKKLASPKRQAPAEQLWLNYYNDTLMKSGLITEEQYNRMKLRIIGRKAQ